MKYIDEFRNGDIARAIASKIRKAVDSNKHYKLMEFCGGHTHALHRYGIPNLLPSNVEMIHGPGCPVCVLPIPRIDAAIALSNMPGNILCSYGDMLRVPGSRQESLLKAKARGAQVRMIYSVEDAIKIAQNNPNNKIIFFAIGFETTTPPTAAAIAKAKTLKLKNFSVFCNHVLTPVAMSAILNIQHDDKYPIAIDGFVGPAHVSIVIGSDAYSAVSQQYKKPIVISGFEPLDLMQSIYMLINMINSGEEGTVNQFTRAVTPTGNEKSQHIVSMIFQLRESFEWRGLGQIPKSALKIRDEYAEFDAEKQFTLPKSEGLEHKACDCGAILRGQKKPTDCKLFRVVCTPENPLGSCMVSAEGACNAYYAYDRIPENCNAN